MKNRSMLRRLLLAGLSLFLIAGTGFAQTGSAGHAGNTLQSSKKITVGNAELKRFATALNDVHAIQVDFQKSFQNAVTQSPLSQKRFLQLFRSERTTHKLPADVTSKEKRQYQNLIQTVLKMEQNARTKMVAAVQKDGMKVSRFDTIIRAVNSDPKLAGRLRKIRK